MRRLFTHSSSKLFRRDIFGGIGPSSPLACISLQEFKFEWEYTLNLDLSTIKTQRTWDIFQKNKDLTILSVVSNSVRNQV